MDEVWVRSFKGGSSRLRIPMNFVVGCMVFDVRGPDIDVGPGGKSGTHTSEKRLANLRIRNWATGLKGFGIGNFRRWVISTDGTFASYVPRQLSLKIFVIDRSFTCFEVHFFSSEMLKRSLGVWATSLSMVNL